MKGFEVETKRSYSVSFSNIALLGLFKYLSKYYSNYYVPSYASLVVSNMFSSIYYYHSDFSYFNTYINAFDNNAKYVSS